MKKDFDYKEVPQGYLHCLDAECPHSSECLRFKIGAIVNEFVTDFSIVNPKYVEKQEECPYFQPDELVRYACGISHLYDGLLHTTYVKIKKKVHDYFGHTQYYRIQNKTRLITPKDQAVIREIFNEEGMSTVPVYDEYFENYDFILVGK